jgi:glycosyltransferase involved in cell wall biosynthesis
MLRGNLDKVSSRTISGWARDTSRPEDPVSLIITNNGRLVERVVANRYRDDLKDAAIGNGYHSFELVLSQSLSPFERHIIRVFCEADGTDIPGSPATLEPVDQRNRIKGNLDEVSPRIISGWAHDTFHPDDPVSLLVTDNDHLVKRILANRYREDLKNAAVGNGRHSFEFVLPQSLSPFERHTLRVFCEADGTDIPGSPVTLEPSSALGEIDKQYLAELMGRMSAFDEITAAINFLAVEIDRLKQRQADLQSRRVERAYIEAQQKSGQSDKSQADPDSALAATGAFLRRALIIDDRVPEANRDAGSNVILSHLQSLQRLGYEVVFAPAEQFGEQKPDLSALEAVGATCCRPPFYGSVEEVMRRQARSFDVVYLHRVSNASKYLTLVRTYFPKARIIYSVADLHHIRFARQAAAEDRPELVGWSKRVRLQELMAAATADAVITHSGFEADVLRKEVRGVNVHVVPWSIQVRPTSIPFAKRRGLAFIGSFGHQPNGDAARWLITEIMPLVRRRAPKIECLLVGSEMPDWLVDLCGNGVVAVGHVDSLAEVFDRVRLTVAPLSYGAGVKGKVLESLAAGTPCVCTPVAAEGLELPEILRGCVAESAADIAAIIQKVHGQKKLNQACQAAGLDYIASHFAADQVDQLMSKVIGSLR